MTDRHLVRVDQLPSNRVRIACYFGGSLVHDRGTPLRARNIAVALARHPNVELTVFSPDDSAVIRNVMDVEHIQVSRDQKAATARLLEFARSRPPHLYYGQAHKAIGVLARIPRGAVPRIVDLHGDTVGELWRQSHRPLMRRAFSTARRWAYVAAYTWRIDAFTAVSEALTRTIGPRNRPCLVIRGGVDARRFAPQQRSPDGTIRVAYAGNFRHYQGVRTLVEAMRHACAADDRFQLLLAGTHEDDPGLVDLAVRLLGNRVELAGAVPYADVPRLLASADVLVLPRNDVHEARVGFPSKLAEYMAAGRAVIATDVGEHARMITNGTTGLVVPPSDPIALAEALRRLADGELRLQLATAARRYAEQELAWPELAGKLVAFFSDVIDRRQR